MVAPVSKVPVTASCDDELSLDLLQSTQLYLHGVSQGDDPDGRLLRAWERFYQICDRLLQRCAAWHGLGSCDREDCVQQVWAELLRSLPDFRYDPGRGRFRSWLIRRLRSRAIDLRHRLAKRRTTSLTPDIEASLHSKDGNPVEEYERMRRQEAVQRVLAELRRQGPERSFQVLYLRAIEGWTVPEVAAALGLTPAQVWSREHRMKLKFRRLYLRSLPDAET